MAQIEIGSVPAPDAHAGPLPTVLHDEQALRRAVGQHGEALVAAATRRLGDSAFLAPRVVEQAFVHAWHARADVTSEAALAEFLDEDVERGAARALSRQMAARRLGHVAVTSTHAGSGHARPDGRWDPDVAWSHVLEGARADSRSARAHEQAAAIAHHDAAVHIAEATRPGSWVKPVAFGALTVGAAIAGVWLIDSIGADRRLLAAVTNGPGRTVEAAAGQIGALELADGSRATFAPGTQLFIPQEFGPDLRAVRVNGAARFTVASGQERPLTVVVGPATVTATGTAFTVRAYPGDGGATIVLHEGAASVRRGDVTRPLAPGQAVFVPDSAPVRDATAGQRAELVAWTENAYVASDRRLGDVLEDFQRWYRTRILIAHPELLERRVSVRASLDSVRQAIAAVEREADVKFGYVADKMVFTPRR